MLRYVLRRGQSWLPGFTGFSASSGVAANDTLALAIHFSGKKINFRTEFCLHTSLKKMLRFYY